MQIIPASVENLIAEFAKLPGIGPRTAERLTFFLLRGSQDLTQTLGRAVMDLNVELTNCQTCFNLADSDQCPVCRQPNRSRQLIAVVEEPLDVVALEKTGHFDGLYHVLGGVISPIDGIGPDQLHVRDLVKRVEAGGIAEVILATNPSTEGETTAMYIRGQLKSFDIKITRLARGLPVGGDLEYADHITLGRALEGRQDFK